MNPGDRVELVHCNDKYTSLKPGSQGTVTHVRKVVGLGPEFTQISIDWDDGSRLMLIPEDGDSVRVL